MDAHSYHFIVADDDEHVRFFVKHVIRLTFPEAHIALFGDGAEAWQHFLAHGADALVTDHDMPGMNGAELTHAIREKDRDLPIIMVSNSPEAKQHCATEGIDVFMGKEGILKNLAGVLEGLLANRQETRGREPQVPKT